MKSFGDDAVANIEARDLSRSNPAEYRKMVEKCVRQSQRTIFINEPGTSLVFKEDNECHQALKMLMKERLDDPNMVSRSVVLECVEEAQRIGAQKLKEKNTSKDYQ